MDNVLWVVSVCVFFIILWKLWSNRNKLKVQHCPPSTIIIVWTVNTAWFVILTLFIRISRLKARLQPNIGFTLRRVLAMFTRGAVTSPKVNRFGWSLEHSEYIVSGWPYRRFWARSEQYDSWRARRNFCQL